MNSGADSQTLPPVCSKGIVMVIKRCGRIVGHKNRKKIAGKRLITDPRVKAHMEAIIRNFESELLSFIPTSVESTWTDQLTHSLIASVAPSDDSWTVIPELILLGKLCEKGNEGAEIIIERIQ